MLDPVKRVIPIVGAGGGIGRTREQGKQASSLKQIGREKPSRKVSGPPMLQSADELKECRVPADVF